MYLSTSKHDSSAREEIDISLSVEPKEDCAKYVPILVHIAWYHLSSNQKLMCTCADRINNLPSCTFHYPRLMYMMNLLLGNGSCSNYMRIISQTVEKEINYNGCVLGLWNRNIIVPRFVRDRIVYVNYAQINNMRCLNKGDLVSAPCSALSVVSTITSTDCSIIFSFHEERLEISLSREETYVAGNTTMDIKNYSGRLWDVQESSGPRMINRFKYTRMLGSSFILPFSTMGVNCSLLAIESSIKIWYLIAKLSIVWKQ